MKPQVCIFSVGITSEMIAKELREIQLPAEFVFEEILLKPDTVLPGHVNKFDVFMSSGNNARVLKKKTDKPVIIISPSLYDILSACSKSMQYSNTPVIIMHRDAFSAQDVRQLSNILSVDIQWETYDQAGANIEQSVLRYKEQGYKCIIGSGMVCEYAEKHGLKSIYLFPKESIRNSLETAADLAVSICQKTAYNLQLSTIINNSKQGILFADNRRTVFICNPVALKYLGLAQRDVIGQKVSRFFPPEDVEEMFTSTVNKRFFSNIRDRSFVVLSIPIVSKKEVSNVLLHIEDVSEIQKTEREIRREVWTQKGFIAKYTFEKYRSVNREFLDFLSVAKSFARTDEPVVILGETGAGKEVLAQSIHNHSARAGKAFVAVNCAAIPENLLESELFGYSEGAFTGARKGGKEGYFEMAHMGTIFLDEIGEMSPVLQSKLLRVIQEKQVLRVGGTKLIPFDARLIVATNKNLWELVQDNTFRKDLYYRLNVLELEIPPLRDRPDDMLMLFADFLSALSPSAWEVLAPLSGELERQLSAYYWPGNVRELENFVHMLVAYRQPGDPPEKLMTLIIDILGKKCRRASPLLQYPSGPAAPVGGTGKIGTIKSCERGQIREALDASGGSIPQAAGLLGIHRTTLWRKLRQLEEAGGEKNI